MSGKNAVDVLMRFSRLNLASFGAWPEYKNKILSNLSFFIMFSIIMFSVFLPQGIKLMQVRNLDAISEILSIAELPFLVALTKMSVLYYNKEKLTILYDSMVDDWTKNRTNEEMEIMMRKGDKGRKIALICISLGHATTNSRMIQCIFENLNNWKFKLYLEAFFPYDWHYSPLFELTCITQYIGAVFATFAYTGTDAICSQIVLHFSGEYQILRLQFLEIVNNFNVRKTDHEFDEKIGYIVEVHEHINSCISMLESIYYLMFLVQLIACSLQFCLQGFLLTSHITDTKSNSTIFAVVFIIVFLMYVIGNFYVYCYLGEELQMESYAFAQAVYNSEWYNLPSKKAKFLILLMQSGHKPSTITAGKFCDLNLNLFGSIMKTSMGYLSFLITMGRKN